MNTSLKLVDENTTCAGRPYFAELIKDLYLLKVEQNPSLYIKAQNKEQRNLALKLLENK